MQGYFAYDYSRVGLATVVAVAALMSVPQTMAAQQRSATIRVSAYVVNDGLLSIGQATPQGLAAAAAQHGVDWSAQAGSVLQVSAPASSHVTVTVQALDARDAGDVGVEAEVCQETAVHPLRCRLGTLRAGDDLTVTSSGSGKQWLRIGPPAGAPPVRVTVAYL